MGNCLITQLNSVVSNDNLDFLNSKRLFLGIGKVTFKRRADRTLQIKIEKGTLYKGDGTTVIGVAGDIVNVESSGEQGYRVLSLPFEMRFINNEDVDMVSFDFLQKQTNVADYAVFINASQVKTSAEISNKLWVGKIEDYVERAVRINKTVDVTINGNYLTFNEISETGQVFRIHFTTTTVEVYLKGSVTTTETLVGTYAKATGVWTYA